MRKTNNLLRLIIPSPLQSTGLSDTSGNPSESYNWGHMTTLREEWLHQFRHPYVNAFEPTTTEIMSNEMRVRKELYP